jgi:hypothetical protein
MCLSISSIVFLTIHQMCSDPFAAYALPVRRAASCRSAEWPPFSSPGPTWHRFILFGGRKPHDMSAKTDQAIANFQIFSDEMKKGVDSNSIQGKKALRRLG